MIHLLLLTLNHKELEYLISNSNLNHKLTNSYSDHHIKLYFKKINYQYVFIKHFIIKSLFLILIYINYQY